MHLREPAHRVRTAAGLAAGGVLIGHSLTYAVVAPDIIARDRLLASTGHGYLPEANALALIAVLVTLSVLFLGRLTRPWTTPGWKPLGARVAVLQVGAFLSMELLERMGSGSPLAGLGRGGLLPIGVGVQLLIAGAMTLLVRFLLRASDAVAAALGRTPGLPAVPESRSLPGRSFTPPTHPDLLLAFSRGPPTSR